MKKKRFLGILLTLVMLLGLMTGMSLTAQATNAVNVKITSKGSSSSTIWTIASSTTLPQNCSVGRLVPQLNWDSINPTGLVVNGTNAKRLSGNIGKETIKCNMINI